MNEWSESVDENDDDAFTWHASDAGGSGKGGGMSIPDKVTLLRGVEAVSVLSLFRVSCLSCRGGFVFVHSIALFYSDSPIPYPTLNTLTLTLNLLTLILLTLNPKP